MLLKQDLDMLWDAHEKTKDAGKMLAQIAVCKTDPKAQYYRSQIRNELRQARAKMKALKHQMQKNSYFNRKKEREDMFK